MKTDGFLKELDRLNKQKAAIYDDPKLGENSREYRDVVRQIARLKAERAERLASQTDPHGVK